MARNAASVSARFSKSLARQRLRPNHEKVRSTTHRRGRTSKPFMSSLRLNDLEAQVGLLGNGGIDLRGFVSAVGPDHFEPAKAAAYLVENQRGSVAVLDRGGVDDDAMRLSTPKVCRCRGGKPSRGR
jgi:hypothetical protein